MKVALNQMQTGVIHTGSRLCPVTQQVCRDQKRADQPVVSLQACGVDFEIRAFCAKSIEEKIHKR